MPVPAGPGAQAPPPGGAVEESPSPAEGGQGQGGRVPGAGQQPEGHRRVGGERQQRAVGDGRRHRRRQESQRGLEGRQDRRRQQSPGQGEGQAHPPPEIAREAGVVQNRTPSSRS